MSITLRYTEVLMSGNDSPCHENSYVIVVDGDGDANEKKITKSDNMFTERMREFSITHPSDYNIMVERAKEKGVLKWVAQESGNVISDMLCVEAREEPEPEPVAVAAVQAAAEPRMVRADEVLEQDIEPGKEINGAEEKGQAVTMAKIVDIPNIGQSLVCKRKQHCYLRPATPGMTRQLGSAKTHAFVNGGRLPGQGSCGNYCVSRFSSNNLSAIDIAKSRALAQFL